MYFNVENGCTGGSSGFLAVQMLKAGSCDVALAIGAKMNITDKARMFSVFDGAWDLSEPDANLARLLGSCKRFCCARRS
ncbi:hypothetical protein L3081_00010 [Colwellia sp. MSW7]|uniref:Thiolase N-terminal domain-containing protein n=1 Tax=Colwellia maritima TaxID=2912588 RepID=A0ABS9WX73_9GAMM|nr:hypothetical protein [Colwellia maritima]MCI2282072.1 hypothetical protein [Colwellia maritima]